MAAGQIPAAQYLRMSTDKQEYSLLNQAEAIAKYAERNGFVVVKTYKDPGRSGLVLRERPGLRALLSDVVKPHCDFQAILVYDVSRWGRFQDSDEAASYEFLCRQAGAQVYYCAESFQNDLSISSSIMKALKRSMAAEYSRELGIRCYDGQKRLAEMGFRMGGVCGYGLRRMLLSGKGKKLRRLRRGEYKSLSTDKVVLVPGPNSEVEAVRKIYAMLLDGLRPAEIVRRLNCQNVKYLGDKPWDFNAVMRILRSPTYTGTNVWGQSSRKLHSKCKWLPRKEWICAPNAFPAIVDQKTYERAQTILHDTTANRSNESLLNDLKRLLKRKGYLTMTLIEENPKLVSYSCYRNRFGSLRNVYRLVGYHRGQEYFRRRGKAMVTMDMRKELMDAIVTQFPGRIAIRKDGRKYRGILIVDGHIVVSVVLCRWGVWRAESPSWRYYPTPSEKEYITLLCTMNSRNDGIEGYYLFQHLGRAGTYRFGRNNKWLRSATRLNSVSELCDVLSRLTVQTSGLSDA